MLKMAPVADNNSRVGKIAVAACVIGVYAMILTSLGVEMYHDFSDFKPGVAHPDPRMMTPEAQHQLFSLKD